MTRLVARALVAGILLVAPACDGSSSSTSPTTPPTSSTTAPPTSTTAAAVRLTPEGYGRLLLGMTLKEAGDRGLIGPTRPGCELGGPGEVVGEIGGTGAAYFNDGVLTGISIHEGATTAEGIAPGSTLESARKVYGGEGFSLEVDDSTLEVFGVLIASVEQDNREAYDLLVDPKTERVESLWIPAARFCD